MPTDMLTNSPEIAFELDRRCICVDPHAQLMNCRPTKAAKYTDEFCQAVLTGFRRQLEQDGVYFVTDLFEELAEVDYEEVKKDKEQFPLEAAPEGKIPNKTTREQEARPLPEFPTTEQQAEDDATPPEKSDEPLVEEVPDREHQAILLKMHKNLGHPKLEDFLRALRGGGVRASI